MKIQMIVSKLLRSHHLLKGCTRYYKQLVITPQTAYLSLFTNITIPNKQFSTAPPDKDEKELNSSSLKSFQQDLFSKVLTPKNQFYALVGGGTLGAYLISKGLLAFTNFFAHLNPAYVAKYGFYTGFGTATLLGGMALITADNLYLRADPVYRYCYKWVRGDEAVKQALGDGIQAGSLTSYRIDSGGFRFEGNKPVWTPSRIQMVFL